MSDEALFEAYRAAWRAWKAEHEKCCRLTFITGHEAIAEAAFSAAWEAGIEWERGDRLAYAEGALRQEADRTARHHGGEA